MSEEVKASNTGDNTADIRLKQFITNIEAIEVEKRKLSKEISLCYSEAKSSGFDVKAIRRVIALRRKRPEEVQEETYLVETYMSALGGN